MLNRLDFLSQRALTIKNVYNGLSKRTKGVVGLQELAKLAKEFAACQKTLLALGDENRQHLILEMMQMGKCSGARVGEITQRTHLSRPAVSHHLRILKDAGLIKMRREGTRNYYYFDADTQAMRSLLQMLHHANEIMQSLPNRNGVSPTDCKEE